MTNAAAAGWRAIDSAPKGQSVIMFWEGKGVLLARYNGPSHGNTHSITQPDGKCFSLCVTHWVPIPEPPVATQAVKERGERDG